MPFGIAVGLIVLSLVAAEFLAAKRVSVHGTVQVKRSLNLKFEVLVELPSGHTKWLEVEGFEYAHLHEGSSVTVKVFKSLVAHLQFGEQID